MSKGVGVEAVLVVNLEEEELVISGTSVIRYIIAILTCHWGGLAFAGEALENIYSVSISKEAASLNSVYDSYLSKISNYRKNANKTCFRSNRVKEVSLSDEVAAIAYMDTVVDISLCSVLESFVKNKVDSSSYEPDCTVVKSAVKEFSRKLNPQFKNCMVFFEKQISNETRAIASQVSSWKLKKGGAVEK